MEIKWEIASSNTNVILPHKQISRAEGLCRAATSPTASPPICPPPPLAIPPPPHPPSPLGRSDDTAGEQIVSSSGHVRDVYSEGSPDVLSKKRERAPPSFLCLYGATKAANAAYLPVLRFWGLNVSSLMCCRVSVATQRVTQVKKTAHERSSGLHTNKHTHRTVTCIALNVENV